jgi:hypothetical protein
MCGNFHRSTKLNEAPGPRGREFTRHIEPVDQGRMTVNTAGVLAFLGVAMLSLIVGCAAVREGEGPSTATMHPSSVQRRFWSTYSAPTPAADPLQSDWSDTDPPMHPGQGHGHAVQSGYKTFVNPD